MDFPSNSQNVVGPKSSRKSPKLATEKDLIEKIVLGEVMQRTPSLGRKFKNIFFGGEARHTSRYVFADVLLPALRNMFVDATTKGVERIVYGQELPRRSVGPTVKMSYNQPLNRSFRSINLPDQPRRQVSSIRRQEADDIILASRGEAELVIERMHDISDKYGFASLADLHNLVGLPSSFTHNEWGWTTLSGASVRQIRDGYLLELPQIEAI
jgi:hypothetical protein